MSSPYRKVVNPVTNCNLCNEEIVWTVSKAGKNIPVNADSCDPMEMKASPDDANPDFDRTRHTCHWETCIHAKPRKPKTQECRKCGGQIVWMKTRQDKNVPVQAATVSTGDTVFDKTKHTAHFDHCKKVADETMFETQDEIPF